MITSHHGFVECWTPGAAPDTRLRLAWQTGRCGTVRITGADVLRISSRVAVEALTVLESRQVPLGPILANRNRSAVEFIVPAGTAATWPALPHTRCVETAVMRCPAPAVTAASRRRVQGRTWICAPSPERPAATDADALCEAVTTAIAARGTRILRISPHANRQGEGHA
ncbi:hypothetical protein [Streptomyces sp. NBC_00134]|uniref:hypothetical protein n=1 Tax=Streptomyces sp. NBC_00134 TaxID=2975663 RepID=UPI002F910743